MTRDSPGAAGWEPEEVSRRIRAVLGLIVDPSTARELRQRFDGAERTTPLRVIGRDVVSGLVRAKHVSREMLESASLP